MVLKEKFEATRDYLQLAHGDALAHSLGVPTKAEEVAADVWGEDFITRIWNENPQTAWADFFICPNLDVLLIVGEQDLQTDGKFYVTIFDSPVQVEKFGEDRLYIYYDKELPLDDAPENVAYKIIELAGYDTGEWDVLEWEHADVTDRKMHRVIFEPAF